MGFIRKVLLFEHIKFPRCKCEEAGGISAIPGATCF
jgi:hypothetical protein